MHSLSVSVCPSLCLLILSALPNHVLTCDCRQQVVRAKVAAPPLFLNLKYLFSIQLRSLPKFCSPMHIICYTTQSRLYVNIITKFNP